MEISRVAAAEDFAGAVDNALERNAQRRAWMKPQFFPIRGMWR